MRRFFVICSSAVIAATTLFAQGNAKREELSANKDGCKKPTKDECSKTAKPKEKETPCCNLGQGAPLISEKKCFLPGYNAPAGIDVKGWDFDLFGSFIYWNISQDGMDLAHVLPFSTATTATSGAVAFQNFKYEPGFKAGLGFNTNYDGWVGWAEYTWLHQKTTTSKTAPALPTGPGTWTSQDWFTSLGITGPSVSSKWKMNLDMVDALFSRPFYQGTRITVSPFAGVRGLWIRQNLSIDFEAAPVAFGVPQVDVKSHSWAVGLNTGMTGNWMLGTGGFRLEGKVAGSLLYTRYTKFSHSESDSSAVLPVTTTLHNISAVRPVAELGAGFGWGRYFGNNSYFLDLSARYDFMLLWEQNVMREYTSTLQGYVDSTGDLRLHGLTASARLHF